MRYTEDQYQAFLNHLIIEIIEEHNRIGIAADQWKSSFRLITPDFHRENDENGTLIFPTARPSAKKELPAEPERGAAKKEVIEEDEKRKNAIGDREEQEKSASAISEKENFEMPRKFNKVIEIDGVLAHTRERVRGNSVNYEVRCRMDGINISASATTPQEAWKRFVKKLRTDKEETTKPAPPLFGDFLMFYFENFRKRKVAPETYEKDLSRAKRHILPEFAKMKLAEITPSVCQNFIDRYTERGKTAEELFSLLSQTFKCAIAHHLIPFSPLDTVICPEHESEHGVALTRKEEAILLASACPDCKESLAIILYTGLRPCEYTSLRREGDMLIAQNRKRKDGKIEYKRIPICPMLAPFVSEKPVLLSRQVVGRKLKKILHNHKPYDLRTTFNTRCVECHVDDNARKLMMGHSLGVLANAYTDVSDDFLKAEAAKISYNLPPILPPNAEIE